MDQNQQHNHNLQNQQVETNQELNQQQIQNLQGESQANQMKEEQSNHLQQEEEIKVNNTSEIQNYKGIKHFLSSTDYHYPIANINYHTIAVAPMIDITDVHFRNFIRLLTRYSILYTEMIHEQAVHHNIRGPQEFLKFDPVQHPVVIQLGGNDPDNLAKAAKICEEIGYDEVNLNVGCPSDRVQSGKFGACLMKEPEVVAEIMRKMKETCSIPVTVKCRLGVDNFDSYEFARDFIKIVSEKGQVQHFVVHARKAFLKGLNPAQNRNVPPLKYDYVLRLKQEFPHLQFSINGGFKTYDQISDILKTENGLHGCMLGRAAYETPWLFSDMDRRFYGKQNPGFSRREILKIWGQYGKLVIQQQPAISIPTLNKPIINLFAGEKHSAKYRHFISDRANFIKFENYEIFMQKTIEEYESVNAQALDQRPPGCEQADNSIVEAILQSVKNEQNNLSQNENSQKQSDVMQTE
ncbi:hypothetical protein ABPG73_005956 [Tetrahymena malaccensis]